LTYAPLCMLILDTFRCDQSLGLLIVDYRESCLATQGTFINAWTFCFAFLIPAGIPLCTVTLLVVRGIRSVVQGQQQEAILIEMVKLASTRFIWEFLDSEQLNQDEVVDQLSSTGLKAQPEGGLGTHNSYSWSASSEQTQSALGAGRNKLISVTSSGKDSSVFNALRAVCDREGSGPSKVSPSEVINDKLVLRRMLGYNFGLDPERLILQHPNIDDLTVESLQAILLIRGRKLLAKGKIRLKHLTWDLTLLRKAKLSHFGQLILMYRMNYWWLDIFATVRKLFLVSVMPHIMYGTRAQLIVAQAFCSAWFIWNVVEKPFVFRWHNFAEAYCLLALTINLSYGMHLEGPAGCGDDACIETTVTVVGVYLVNILPILFMPLIMVQRAKFVEQEEKDNERARDEMCPVGSVKQDNTDTRQEADRAGVEFSSRSCKSSEAATRDDLQLPSRRNGSADECGDLQEHTDAYPLRSQAHHQTQS